MCKYSAVRGATKSHVLYVVVQGNRLNLTFEGATKLYFMHYSHMVIIFIISVFSIILEDMYHSSYSTILSTLIAFKFVFILKHIFCLPQ